MMASVMKPSSPSPAGHPSSRPDTADQRPRASVVGALARNLPVSASVAVKFAAQGPRAAWSAALRAVPSGPRRRLTDLLGDSAPVLAALAMAASGQRQTALDRLAATRADRPGRRDAAVDALVVLHRPDLARAMVTGPTDPRVLARLLVEEGNYSTALSALDIYAHRRLPGRRTKLLRRVITGERSALDPGPRLAATSRHPVRPVPGSVLHLVTTALPEAQTGYTIRTQGIARAQAAAGRRVAVVSRIGFPVDTGHPAAGPETTLDGVSYHRLLPTRPLPLGAGARLDLAVEEVTGLVERLRPAVLHAHSKHDNAQVAIAVARRTCLPVVYEVRGFLEETWRTRGGDADSERYRLTRAAETACLLAADAVVTLSESMRAAILARGVAAERVTVVPNAVPDDYLADPPEGAAERARLGIAPGTRVVGFSGTLNTYEGLDTVLRAVARLADPSVLVLIVGDGPARDALRTLAAELGVTVRFTGRVPHGRVRDYLAAMDVFCVPRRRTPVTELVPPLKPLEALATGVPVVVSELPPLTELLDDAGAWTGPDAAQPGAAGSGPVGWAVPPEDPERWADALRTLLDDPDRLARAGARGRAWACAERTWARLVESYGDVYRAASERAARRRTEGRP